MSLGFAQITVGPWASLGILVVARELVYKLAQINFKLILPLGSPGAFGAGTASVCAGAAAFVAG